MSTTPTTQQAPVFALPKVQAAPAPSQALTVYRPPVHELARRVRDSIQTLDKGLEDKYHYYQKPRAVTDEWAAPAILGGLVAGSVLFVFGLEAAAWAGGVFGVGAAASGVGLVLHPSMRRLAEERARPLLDGNDREAVLQLVHAKTDFPATEGGIFEAPEVDHAIAGRARFWLEELKKRGVTDRKTLTVLEDFVKAAPTLDDVEEKRLDTCLSMLDQLKSQRIAEVLAAFEAMSDAEKREIIPFLRDHAYTEDHPKVGGSFKDHMALHHAMEAVDPTLPPHAIKQGEFTAGDKIDVVDVLQTVLELQTSFAAPKRDRNDVLKPEYVAAALGFAKDDTRTAVERALIGIMAERALAAMNGYHFRVRHSFEELVAIGNAQVPDARVEAHAIAKLVDTVSDDAALQISYEGAGAPDKAMRKVIALVEISRR